MTATSPTGTGVSVGGANTTPEGFLGPEAMLQFLSDRLEARLLDSIIAYGQLTIVVEPAAWVDTVRLCKEDPALECRFWEFLDAVDAGDEGFDVNVHVYSVKFRHDVTIRTRAPGGREKPVMPSLTDVFRGANWSERETYDMFGIEFEGHPSVLPRILTVENFEGWPLRKDFQLTSRNAKPWPGAKEPEEHKAGEGGEAAAVESGATPADPVDKAEAAKAKAERAKAKAAAMRAQKAAERAEAQSAAAPVADQAAASDAQRTTTDEAAAAADAQPGSDLIADSVDQFGGGDTEDEAAAAAATAGGDPTGSTPEGAAEVAGSNIAKDAAAGAPQGDLAQGAPQDAENVDEPVVNAEGEAQAAQGAADMAGGTPGPEVEGRHGGAEQQSGATPAAETPGMTSDTQGLGAARTADEVPAPGPESDRPLAPEEGASSTPHGGSPMKAEDDVPVVPAQGSAAAPLDSDLRPEDAEDERHGLQRETLGVADADVEGDQQDVTQERVEEGPSPHPSPSEHTDAADRADPDRDLASDHAEGDDAQ